MSATAAAGATGTTMRTAAAGATGTTMTVTEATEPTFRSAV
jgi:hypothetical protein